MLNFSNAYDFMVVYIDVEGSLYRCDEDHMVEI